MKYIIGAYNAKSNDGPVSYGVEKTELCPVLNVRYQIVCSHLGPTEQELIIL